MQHLILTIFKSFSDKQKTYHIPSLRLTHKIFVQEMILPEK